MKLETEHTQRTHRKDDVDPEIEIHEKCTTRLSFNIIGFELKRKMLINFDF